MSEATVPLILRKSIQDEFDPFKAEFAAETEKLFGTPWTMEPSWVTIYKEEVRCHEKRLEAAAPETRFAANAGTWMKEWFKSALHQLGRFTQKGEDKVAVNAIYEACPAKIIAVGIGGPFECKLADGKLWILFWDGNALGNRLNIHGCLKKLPEMVIDPVSGLSLAILIDVRDELETDYLPRFGNHMKELFGEPWSADYDWALLMDKGSSRMKKRPGTCIKDYLSAADRQLQTHTKQGKDTLVVEALQEKVYTRTVSIAIDDSMSTLSSHRIKDGKLWLLFKSGEKFGSESDKTLVNLLNSL